MNKLKKKIKPVHIIRRVTQLSSFLLLPGLFTTTFYTIKEIYIVLKGGSFTFTEFISQTLLLMATILVTIFMGRFFCGFICSFGSMGDFLWFLSQKTIKPRFKIGEKEDAVLKFLKYGILLFLIIGVWTFNLFTFDSMDSPWTVFGMYASIGNWNSTQYLFSLGGLLLLLIMIGSFFIERFFCKYLCPLGAVFAITSKLRLFQINKNRDKCGSCRICTSKCSMGIPLYQYDKVTSVECINCFSCVDNCPRDNVKANPAPTIVSAVTVATIFGLVYAGNIASGDVSDIESSVSNTLNLDTGNYVDGTNTGTAFGFRGDTDVSVTVKNGNITDITVLSYEDDEEYFIRTERSVITAILNSQDVDVDTVSGATFSSNGIIDAVADALSISVESNTASNSSTSNIGNDNTINNTDSKASTSDYQVYKDGIYTGIGSGFRGDTEVSVTVIDGRISEITMISYMDDKKYFLYAEERIISEIIENQDVNVDAVSGATFSSNSIMEAVAKAIGVSYTNTNETNARGGHGHGGLGNH